MKFRDFNGMPHFLYSAIPFECRGEKNKSMRNKFLSSMRTTFKKCKGLKRNIQNKLLQFLIYIDLIDFGAKSLKFAKIKWKRCIGLESTDTERAITFKKTKRTLKEFSLETLSAWNIIRGTSKSQNYRLTFDQIRIFHEIQNKDIKRKTIEYAKLCFTK